LCLNINIKNENKGKGMLEATYDDISKGTHIQADIKEFEKFVKLNVFDFNKIYNSDKDPPPIKTRLIRTFKLVSEGLKEERIPKTRFVCKGFQDDRLNNNLLTYSPTSDKNIINIIMMYILNNNVLLFCFCFFFIRNLYNKFILK